MRSVAHAMHHQYQRFTHEWHYKALHHTVAATTSLLCHHTQDLDKAPLNCADKDAEGATYSDCRMDAWMHGLSTSDELANGWVISKYGNSLSECQRCQRKQRHDCTAVVTCSVNMYISFTVHMWKGADCVSVARVEYMAQSQMPCRTSTCATDHYATSPQSANSTLQQQQCTYTWHRLHATCCMAQC